MATKDAGDTVNWILDELTRIQTSDGSKDPSAVYQGTQGSNMVSSQNGGFVSSELTKTGQEIKQMNQKLHRMVCSDGEAFINLQHNV